jgi:hypothetical protein
VVESDLCLGWLACLILRAGALVRSGCFSLCFGHGFPPWNPSGVLLQYRVKNVAAGARSAAKVRDQELLLGLHLDSF